MRHPRPLVPEGYIYGAMEDVPLNTTGPQTTAAFNAIAQHIPDDALLLCSPSPRAIKGLSHVLQGRKLSYIEDMAFLEQNFGDWQGQFKKDIAAMPETIAYTQDPMHNAPPNGEDVFTFFARVHKRIEHYCALYQQGHLNTDTIFVSAHGGVSRAALAITQDFPFDPLNLKPEIRRLSLCKTQWNPATDRWQILDQNMTLDQNSVPPAPAP